MSIEATPGGAEANSYLTLAQAEAYFQESYDFASLWSGLSDQDKEQLLVSATRALDRLRFKGRRFDSLTPQALKFPRIIGGQVYDRASDGSLAVPRAVREATCEQARHIYFGGGDQDLAAADVESFRVDKIAVSLSGRTRPRGVAAAAWRLLSPFVAHGTELRRA